ncbi:FtsB family cell division protein [Cryptosporangium phraense]|uniref:Septum formation initiator family protein n=1 Tax=Cryptosporangium phraense TaxID=2593070 RepID=A0A545AGS2_9ACTN|nr:septum formation initiator family protein [Cryptosporangium phraense]TQS40513.1 septum formation initiator family protein [Cryptosporangium phraense]
MATPRRTPSGQRPSRAGGNRRPSTSSAARSAARSSPIRGAGPRGTTPHGGRVTGRVPGKQRDYPVSSLPAQRRGAGRSPGAGSREGRRPGVRRTAASATAAIDGRRFVRRGEGRFTGRAAVLAILFAVLVLTLAYPVQQYLAQRSQIAEAERAQARQSERIAALRSDLEAWNDPEYVRGQASSRLQLVQPGEKRYIVQDPSRAGETRAPETTPSSGSPVNDPRSWYGRLWDSVEEADKP